LRLRVLQQETHYCLSSNILRARTSPLATRVAKPALIHKHQEALARTLTQHHQLLNPHLHKAPRGNQPALRDQKHRSWNPYHPSRDTDFKTRSWPWTTTFEKPV